MRRGALALLAAGAVAAGGVAYFGSVLSGARGNFGLLASRLQAGVPRLPAPEREAGTGDAGAPVGEAPSGAAVAIDLLDAAWAARSTKGALDALQALEAELDLHDHDDKLLVIERGAPTFGFGSSAGAPSPLARRVQAARAGDEAAMAELVTALESSDPAVSRAAWSALSGLAYSRDLAKLGALLADSDPAVRERATQVLRELPYD